MPELGLHGTVCLLLTVGALIAFTSERIRLETSSLGLMVILGVFFSLVPYYDARGEHLEPTALFYGFGHEALIAVCALMVVGQGLVRTGALEPLGRGLARAWQVSPFGSMLITLVLGAVLSAFVNNTPIVVLLLPILISVSIRTHTPASGILMPMGFATLVGGMATTIGTSTNLLVVSVAAELGQPRMNMFDFAAPAAIAASVAVIYLWLIAPRLLPDRSTPIADGQPRLFEARIYLDENSPVVDEPLSKAIDRTDGKLKVVRIRRGNNYILPLPDMVLRAGDRLRVEDTPENLKMFEQRLGGTLFSGPDGETRVDDDHPLSAPDQQLAEIAVAPGSSLDGATLRNRQFLSRYNLVVMAVHRQGQSIMRPKEELPDVTLRAGDVLLVQGPRKQIEAISRNPEFLVLAAEINVPRTEQAPLAILVLIGVIACAATSIMPIAVAAAAGATIMLVTGCLSWGAAIRAISPSVFFVVAASLALGKALNDTGATEWLAAVFMLGMADAPPWAILSALMLLMAVLTNIVSNNAAAVIGTPIAIGIAQSLGVDARPFILAVLFGANMSYATPMAYKTNLLVMSAGNYTFSDFLKVGVPLTIIMWITLSIVLGLSY